MAGKILLSKFYKPLLYIFSVYFICLSIKNEMQKSESIFKNLKTSCIKLRSARIFKKKSCSKHFGFY